jgi:hypothetical protein
MLFANGRCEVDNRVKKRTYLLIEFPTDSARQVNLS